MKDVVKLVMDDGDDAHENATPSFIRPGKRRAGAPKKKDGSPGKDGGKTSNAKKVLFKTIRNLVLFT